MFRVKALSRSFARIAALALVVNAACLAGAQRNLAPARSGLTAVATGTGPDVVLVHGALGDYRQWADITDDLRNSYRVISISRRGHWPNTPPEKAAVYTYQSNRDDLLAFLRANGGPVHLVGHSYGAGVALLAALSEPQLVRSLILIEPGFGSSLPEAAPGLEIELASRTAMRGDVQSLVHSGQDERAAEVLIDWTQGGRGGFAKIPATVRNNLLSNSKTMGPAAAVPPPNLACDDLRKLRVPTIVLIGDNTRLYYRLVAERVASCVPDATTGQIPGAGHMTIVEQPNAVAARLMAFLQDH